ncbi:hypothetical protein SERLA73DRAFT_75034 [Serpula lacrymans var. lacrymans S7.3]|uniref:Uncharacterized protein n=1 Tax=Serpula lacrymans var. lacrymans (strain S7.3) TaxID=936435 RepID=F8Q2B9_SERL3|nr:hypothetical protein SERLA73DRAFT_75034 [Serpula lacrymans var. lacrymans S7.3]
MSSTASSPSSTSSLSPEELYITVSNMTTCTSANISWAYDGPPANLSIVVMPQSTVSGIYLANVEASASFWNWSAVDVPQDLYSITGTSDVPTVIIQSNSFLVYNGTDTSCVRHSTNSGYTVQTASKTNFGAIVGGSIGGVAVVLVVIALLLFFCSRRRSSSRNHLRASSPSTNSIIAHIRPVTEELLQNSMLTVDPPTNQPSPERSSVVPPSYTTREEPYPPPIQPASPLSSMVPSYISRVEPLTSIVQSASHQPLANPVPRPPSMVPSYTSREIPPATPANANPTQPHPSQSSLVQPLSPSSTLPPYTDREIPRVRPANVTKSRPSRPRPRLRPALPRHSVVPSYRSREDPQTNLAANIPHSDPLGGEAVQNGTSTDDSPCPVPAQSPPSRLSTAAPSYTSREEPRAKNPSTNPLPVYTPVIQHASAGPNQPSGSLPIVRASSPPKAFKAVCNQ